jgi:prevent-host-death family protein
MAYTVHQAKTQFSRLLKEVEAGKEVVVMRGKKPVAKLVPVEEPKQAAQRVPGGFEGLILGDDRAFAPLNDAELVELGFGFLVDGEPTGTEGIERPASHDPAG